MGDKQSRVRDLTRCRGPVSGIFTTIMKSQRSLSLASLLFACIGMLLGTADAVRAQSIHLSDLQAERIGRRLWENESGGTIAGLTAWNLGEDFASLGIGHFIWYPAGKRGPFAESFPPLLR